MTRIEINKEVLQQMEGFITKALNCIFQQDIRVRALLMMRCTRNNINYESVSNEDLLKILDDVIDHSAILHPCYYCSYQAYYLAFKQCEMLKEMHSIKVDSFTCNFALYNIFSLVASFCKSTGLISKKTYNLKTIKL